MKIDLEELQIFSAFTMISAVYALPIGVGRIALSYTPMAPKLSIGAAGTLTLVGSSILAGGGLGYVTRLVGLYIGRKVESYIEMPPAIVYVTLIILPYFVLIGGTLGGGLVITNFCGFAIKFDEAITYFLTGFMLLSNFTVAVIIIYKTAQKVKELYSKCFKSA